MERNSLFYFPRLPRSSGLLFALLFLLLLCFFFSFLRTENVAQCKEQAAGRPCSALTLEHAIPETQTAFQRGNILRALTLAFSSNATHFIVFGFFSSLSKPCLIYSIICSFSSKLIFIQSYLSEKKKIVFITGKPLFSWNFLFFLG